MNIHTLPECSDTLNSLFSNRIYCISTDSSPCLTTSPLLFPISVNSTSCLSFSQKSSLCYTSLLSLMPLPQPNNLLQGKVRQKEGPTYIYNLGFQSYQDINVCLNFPIQEPKNPLSFLNFSQNSICYRKDPH